MQTQTSNTDKIMREQARNDELKNASNEVFYFKHFRKNIDNYRDGNMQVQAAADRFVFEGQLLLCLQLADEGWIHC